jgi:hypothetical protein
MNVAGRPETQQLRRASDARSEDAGNTFVRISADVVFGGEALVGLADMLRARLRAAQRSARPQLSLDLDLDES